MVYMFYNLFAYKNFLKLISFRFGEFGADKHVYALQRMFTYRSKAVLLLWILFVNYGSRLPL